MLFYKLHIDGKEDTIAEVIDILSTYDDIWEENDDIRPDYDFMEDGNPQISDVDEVVEMVQEVAEELPKVGILVTGTVKNHDYYMDFEVKYKAKRLTKRYSEWYSSYHVSKSNYKSYADFCEATNLGSRVTENQFNEWINEDCDISVLDSGEGEVVTEVPLSDPVEVEIDD